MTENHNYETPSEGQTDWHIPVNDNFAQLDSDVEVRDAESNLGQYTPKSGAKFLATDTENMFIGDGNQWNQLASSGRSPSFSTINTGNISIGKNSGASGKFAERPLVSNESTSVDVPGDYNTIQEALNKVPVFNRHKYQISLDSNYGLYDEDIIIPPVYALDIKNKSNGLNATLQIMGQAQSGGVSKVGSVYVTNPSGVTSVRLNAIEPTRMSPYGDDQAGIIVYGGQGQVYISNSQFTTDFGNGSNGIMGYGGAGIRVEDVNFGDHNLDYGIRSKAQADIYVRAGAQGTVNQVGYVTTGGSIQINESSLSGDGGIARANRGWIIDGDNKDLYGVNNLKG